MHQSINNIAVLQIQDVYPGSQIRIFYKPDPGSRIKKISGSQIRIRKKEYKYFNPKIVYKLSKIWSGMFIPNPDPGSATL